MHVVIPHEPSKRSKELAARLRTTIDDFRLRDAKLTDAEIEAALASLRKADPNETKKALGVLAAFAAAFVAVVIAVAAEKGRMTEATPMPAGVYLAFGAVVVGVTIAVVLVRRSR